MFNSFFLFGHCFLFIGSLLGESISNDKPPIGQLYSIKGLDTTYTQHFANERKCYVRLNDKLDDSKIFYEGERLKIEKKWYKVEDCRISRAYLAPCGSKLFFHLRDLACSFLDHYYTDDKVPFDRPVKALSPKINHASPSYHPCCESVCTISELIQACSEKW